MTSTDRAREALEEHSEQVMETLVTLIAALGSNEEWSMEDNFTTTEAVAALATVVGLPAAGDQSPSDLAFWREVADETGVDYKVDEAIGFGSSMYDAGAMG